MGGIARSTPALARAVAEIIGDQERVLLLAPRCYRSALPENSGKLELHLSGSASAVEADFERLTGDGKAVRYVYQSGIWHPLNHMVAAACKKKQIPLMIAPRSMLDDWALKSERFSNWFFLALRHQTIAAGGNSIHATSQLEAQHIRNALGRSCPPVFVSPNGIEVPPHLRGAEDDLPLAPPADNNDSKERILLFLSRMCRKKAVHELIQVFHELNVPGWKLRIAGDGDSNYVKYCQRLTLSLNTGGRVQFLGPISEQGKWAVYHQADLFVQPSYCESFGLSIAEALAAGVPVLTTTSTPWAEFAAPEPVNRGLHIYEPGRNHLRTALNQLLEHPPPKGDRCWVRKTFTWQRAARELLEHWQREVQ
ncbi:MAG: glycosyltransferase [Verrucomicrobia bacterium]|nr:glycosyltransferase [Verrucomicrobiota bacterium]